MFLPEQHGGRIDWCFVSWGSGELVLLCFFLFPFLFLWFGLRYNSKQLLVVY